MSMPSKPLAGLKVVELGTLIAGPFAARILAEFGAEVIKIESPDGGDPLRKWRKLYEGTSLWWYLQSRNKKSVTVNLKHPAGQELVRKLVAGADIVVENFRPGVLEKLGLGWEALSAINPGLVMLRLSGFGQTGPMAAQPGFGAIGELGRQRMQPEQRRAHRDGQQLAEAPRRTQHAQLALHVERVA